MKIIVLNTHPIQYYAPLYKKMSEQGLDLEVWYCSDESLRGQTDPEFGVPVQWDVPLLQGYRSRFFKNYARRGSIFGGFFGLLNWGLLGHLWRAPRSLAVVTGWGFLIQVLFVLVAKLAGHRVALRCEAPLHHELRKQTGRLNLRRRFLKYGLFRWIDYFLYIGQQNRQLYQYYGVAEGRLFFAPYAVDNERFQALAAELRPQKSALKAALGLPSATQVILFVGKYVPKKRPLDLLAAYQRLGLPNTALVMVGEGELRGPMEQFVQTHGLTQVILTGFVNQSTIGQYYAMADVLVMSSEQGETWGLAANEAMNFGVPVILSDLVGCAADLVPAPLAAAQVFPVGDVEGLAQRLAHCLAQAGPVQWPLEVVAGYSYQKTVDSFQQILALG
jgi:glycosyltransferase involved in cell wall biosynthesis